MKNCTGSVSRFANALKHLGCKDNDRAVIYMPMIPELPIAVLACARLGIIHSVVFGGFSAEALRTRIQDLGRASSHYRRWRLEARQRSAAEGGRG